MDQTSLLYSNNGTSQVISVDSPSPVAEAIIIIICYLFGVCYNLIIIITVLYNYNLRTCSFYILVLQVSISCLLDCLTNESIALESLLYGVPCCGFSAVVFHFFLLVHSTSIGLMLLERTLSMKMHLLSVKVVFSGVLFSWVFGFVFISPMFGTFEVHYFPNRNACSAATTNLWFSVFSLMGFIIIWGLMGKGVLELVCHFKKHLSDRKQLDIISIFPSSSSEILSPVSPETHNNKNKTTYTVLFLYSVLLLPLSISFSVTLFLTLKFEPNPWIDPRVRTNNIRSVLTNSLEPLFVYSRYIYNALVPIIVLLSERDIRLQSRQMFCSKRNVITSFDQDLSIVSSRNVTLRRTLMAPVTICSLRTPVLFVTSKGLHLRSCQNVQTRMRENMTDSKSKVRLIRTFCDLTINSTVLEGGSYNDSQTQTQTVPLGEGDGRPIHKRCVRFSSQVDAMSAPESRLSVWSSADVGNTRTLTSPLYVTSDHHLNNVGQT